MDIEVGMSGRRLLSCRTLNFQESISTVSALHNHCPHHRPVIIVIIVIIIIIIIMAFSVSWSYTLSVGLLDGGSARRKASTYMQNNTNTE
jgi:heme/copper-type cytochrome/quinol oxidase subunit 2